MKARADTEKQAAGAFSGEAVAERIDSKRSAKDVMEHVYEGHIPRLRPCGHSLRARHIRLPHNLRHTRHTRSGAVELPDRLHLGSRQQDRAELRHTADGTHQRIRHLRRDNHRRADRLPHGGVPLQGRQPQGGRRDTRGRRPPRRHTQRGVRPGRHDGAGARHPQRVPPRRRRQPARRHRGAGRNDSPEHHLRFRDGAQRRAARVRGGVPRPRRNRA